ncbi:MAG: cobalamin-dependent protein [Deltaproteobacteria bacterium]|nr:cobalamin-dependent protein [Deltaproteobacteria bacterium]
MDAHYTPQNAIRIVTAASLFDGHDASINIMRRILQSSGAEVIHLGHNRSVIDVVSAAVQEDAQAVAVSSYQGGHMEFFRYMRQLLDARGAAHVKIFGGGGGVIVAEEMEELHRSGVERIYSPEDGIHLGLQGIINDLLTRSDFRPSEVAPTSIAAVRDGVQGALARLITLSEEAVEDRTMLTADLRDALAEGEAIHTPILGITGPGGAGKSSLTDELLRRYLEAAPDTKVAVLSVDPTRKRTGGALLGDRIRMNALDPDRVFMRSLATRDRKGELSEATRDAANACRLAGYDLVVVETSGTGQGDADIVSLADLSLYVMTPEYGAPTQLEKIEMLDQADLVVINKLEKRGGLDALRDVRKQVRRNLDLWTAPDEALPVFGTIASRFNDQGVNRLFEAVQRMLLAYADGTSAVITAGTSDQPTPLIGGARVQYLADIARTVRSYHAKTDELVALARRRQGLATALEVLGDDPAAEAVRPHYLAADASLDPQTRAAVDGWPEVQRAWSGDTYAFAVRGKTLSQPLTLESLSHLKIPRVVLPSTQEHGAVVEFTRRENIPGSFPFTAGVFPLKRLGEEPKRMFAGEGGPARTNARFHYLCRGEEVTRLSTAFDSVTLYGQDPDPRPDIFGKVGESGVSVPHLDDLKRLYAGFDLCAPTTSVSMTINGPAPMMLAMFFNGAIDQQVDAFTAREGRAPTAEERASIKAQTLSSVRGTVQADILKEDQAQNTCIFSTEFALRMMGDIQRWFIDNDVRNFYSVSVSGYHIAEAGANPISQLAFTLANGFTFVEYYLNRGMKIDDFGKNLSFFFSNGLDPEYTVIGRVARRIWAVAMRDRYGASTLTQKLKYHIQTSGRSLHAREMQFNDIRTTLQALLALADNCNSLHTNAYDEAVTTPTPESVRRAMAIQKIINQEFGLAKNENYLQGSHFIEWLTDRVEEEVLQEFERLSERGGVLGSMELQYQRMKIQEESLYYEHKKHDGSFPIVGINTFLDPDKGEDWTPPTPELRRASYEEKNAQIESVRRFQAAHAHEAGPAIARLQQVARTGGNIFGELMETVRVATLGQITAALFEVGGEYRRNV